MIILFDEEDVEGSDVKSDDDNDALPPQPLLDEDELDFCWDFGWLLFWLNILFEIANGCLLGVVALDLFKYKMLLVIGLLIISVLQVHFPR